MLWIHGGRWDLLDENRPFLGHEPMPPGRALFPPGVTRQDIDRFVAANPATKAAILDKTTAVVRKAQGLAAQPYHVAYRQYLAPAAKALEAAAALSDDPAFAKF